MSREQTRAADENGYASRNHHKGDDEPTNALWPEFIWADDMIDQFPNLRGVVIHGHLRAGETINIIAAPKSQKTFLSLGLAMAVATGRSWLNTFPTTKSKVLYLDFELHRETMARRLRDVAGASGIFADELHGQLAIESLRGRVTDIEGFRHYMMEVREQGFGLIIIDAKYRLQSSTGGEDQANNNSAETAFYNTIDHFAEMTGAAFVCVHHDSKGHQANRSISDRGAGAGSQSRAADCHMTLTPHENDGSFIIERLVRSFPPAKPFVIKWNHPRFEIDPTADPNAFRKPGRANAEPEAEHEWTASEFVRAVFVDDDGLKKEIVRARAEAAGVPSDRRSDKLLAMALDERLIMEIKTGREKTYARFNERLLHA